MTIFFVTVCITFLGFAIPMSIVQTFRISPDVDVWIIWAGTLPTSIFSFILMTKHVMILWEASQKDKNEKK